MDMYACLDNNVLLGAILEGRMIRTVFQPIVSLRDCSVLGYEALSRGPAGSELERPDKMFAAAAKEDKLWQLEKLCRVRALESLGNHIGNFKLFLNINPNTISDRDFKQGFTLEYLNQYNICPQKIVFEITEQHVELNWRDFISVIDSYKKQNYEVAIDDLGAGYSGLSILHHINPHYLKIDIDFVTGIEKDHRKRAMVKSLVEYAKHTNTLVIAEGIETRAELEELIYLGVGYGQGYFIQRPQEHLTPISDEVVAIIKSANRSKNSFYGRSLSELHIGHICVSLPVVDANITTSAVFDMIKKQPECVGTCVIENKRVVGIITKEHLNARLSGHNGFSLYSKRSVQHVMDKDFLMVDKRTSIEKVADLATNRESSKLYDFIVITDKEKYYGIVTIRDLLKHSVDIQVNNAKHLNPLTGLPGNHVIEKKLRAVLDQNLPFSLLYFDLDNFKVYNDVYGFEKGDQILLMLSEVIKNNLEEDTFIGHIGGDDFVVVLYGHESERVCAAMLRDFDLRVRHFYSQQHQRDGYLLAKNRKGITEMFMFCSLSIAVVTNREETFDDHVKLAEKAGEIKKRCKAIEGSAYVIV